LLSLRIALAIVSVSVAFVSACGKKEDSDNIAAFADAESLRPLEGKPMTVQASDVCVSHEDPDFCVSWLGLHGGAIGLTHVDGRIEFAIENVTTDGRFHLAAYPDCHLEHRAASESASITPEDENSEPETAESHVTLTEHPDENVPSLLGDDAPHVVLAEDATAEILSELTESPLVACRKLIAPSSTMGAAVDLLDPDSAGEDAWWRLTNPEAGHPGFVSTKSCEGAFCELRLVVGADGVLTALDVADDELMLRSLLEQANRIGFEGIRVD